VQAGLGLQKYAAIEAHTLPSSYDTSKSASEQGLVYLTLMQTMPATLQSPFARK
jgi:hypothetical protein